MLFEWIVGKGQTVGQAKKDILIQAKKQHMLDMQYSKCRLRKKSWKDPGKVYFDDQRFVEDVAISNSFEMFLQELPDGEKMVSNKQVALFVRRWNPSTISLGPFEEVILENRCVDTLKKRIEDISSIPAEFVQVVHLKQSFPCDMNVLTIHTDLEWNLSVTYLEDYPYPCTDDGNVFFYR